MKRPTLEYARAPGFDYRERHNDAVKRPCHGFEKCVRDMLIAWADYAVAHRAAYGSPICDDGVIGDAWRDQGIAIRALLNGETGRFDCGKLDAFILDTLGAHSAREVD